MIKRLFGRAASAERLAALERKVGKLTEAGRRHAAAIDQRLAQQPTEKDLRELRQAVRGLAVPDDRQILDKLGQIAASTRPILVGPWTGELGFELLYWIPFLNWVRHQWNLAPERQIVISRGGTASWYGAAESNYSDIFSTISPDEFRDAVGERKRKQRHAGPLDDRVVKAVVEARGLGVMKSGVEWLHPGLMFRLFAPFWSDEAGYSRIDQFTRYRLLDATSLPRPAGLPPEYIAVRIYFSECFPATPENHAFAQTLVSSIAERMPVVLLNPGFSVDDHEDWAPAVRDRIHTIADTFRPETNLAVQSAVIAGARGFVGTYGGYAYLAPMYRVPAVAFYSRATFKSHHLYVAQRAFQQMGAAALTVLDTAQAPLVNSVLAAATSHGEKSEVVSGA